MMSGLLGTATLEEFLDLFRVLWFVRLLAYLLMLVALVRMWKAGGLPGGVILMSGISLLIVAEIMGVCMQKGWIELSYSPTYARMRVEWEMGAPNWEAWEPVYWWFQFALGWIGLVVSAVGFFVTGRGMARVALGKGLSGNESEAGD